MPVRFGWTPPPMEISLNADGDFVSAVYNRLGNWPDGTEIAIRFVTPGSTPDVVWPAAIDGKWARWHVDKEDVAAVLALAIDTVKLDYGGASSSIVWYRGVPHDVT